MNEWKTERLGALAAFINGMAFKPRDWDTHGLPIIRIQNLNGSQEFNYFNQPVDDRYLVHQGDLLFSWSGSRGTSFGPHLWQGNQGVLNQHIFRVVILGDLSRDYLFHALRQITQEIERRAHGSAGLVHITKGELERFRIPVPSLTEQIKIAQILSTWDEAIAAAEQLVAALQRRKKGLMQRLLLVDEHTWQPLMRFPGFACQWARKRFDEVFGRVTRKNDIGNKNVLTASGQRGLISQTEYFNRIVAGAQIENYYLLLRGEFAYNRSSADGYPFGAVKRLDNHEEGILSTLYLCFRLIDEASVSSFYKHFFEAGGLDRGIYSIAQEGARNHGLLNVGVADFFNLNVPVPPQSEQQRLADFFDVVDQEIGLAKKQLEALKTQKKGLMQRLLTGQVRVQV